LDEMIFKRLSLHDLSQCARVSKKWHHIFVPYLWRDLSCLDYVKSASFPRGRAFAKLVLEDYLLEQQYQDSQEEDREEEEEEEEEEEDAPQSEQHTQSSRTLPPRRLANYCQWIRELPHAECLHMHFAALCSSSPRIQHVLDQLAQTEAGLMCQLYKQCPNLQIDYWNIHPIFLKKEDVLKVVAEYPVPRTCHLHIGTQHYHTEIPAWRIKHLLSHCSSALEKLTLESRIACSEEEEKEEEETEDHQAEARPWTHLKRLHLLGPCDGPYPKAFWEWLWKRCGAVEQLKVQYITAIRSSLVEGIAAHMPHLTKIHLKECSSREDTEAILATTRQGWKEVIMEGGSIFPQLTTLLMNHSVTLERLVLDRVLGVTDKDRAQLLACCPHLRDFTDLYAVRTSSGRLKQGFDAQCFIDQDHDSGALKSWMCEASLRVLKIRICGIPRPDVKEDLVNEVYLGHGRVMQNRVYDRLARFTNLETLWLGGNDLSQACGCLEMSLESGLDRIAGLKELKELNVSCMRTRIGEEEVKWMVEQWPKLSVVYGLLEKSRDKKAVE
ncbi:hypothetical protein BGX34_002633, partial [Mortierella sp. NVP85]